MDSSLNKKLMPNLFVPTRNQTRMSVSDSPRSDFDRFKPIHDIHKFPDLKQDLKTKYFIFQKSNLLSDGCDGVTNEFTPILDLQSNSRPEVNERSKRHSMKDQCIQTDVCEFAKIKVLEKSNGNASDYIGFAEDFMQELQFKSCQNSTDLTQIDASSDYKTNQNQNNNRLNRLNQYKSVSKSIRFATNDRIYENISKIKTNDMSDLMMRETNGNIGFDSDLHCLTLDSNVIIYKSDNYLVYELAEDAYESQLCRPEATLQLNSLFKYFPSVCLNTQSVKWSTLVNLVKFK